MKSNLEISEENKLEKDTDPHKLNHSKRSSIYAVSKL